jgi:hypothetical protein
MRSTTGLRVPDAVQREPPDLIRGVAVHRWSGTVAISGKPEIGWRPGMTAFIDRLVCVSQPRGAVGLFGPCYFPCSALLISAGFPGFPLLFAPFALPRPFTGIYRSLALACLRWLFSRLFRFFAEISKAAMRFHLLFTTIYKRDACGAPLG